MNTYKFFYGFIILGLATSSAMQADHMHDNNQPRFNDNRPQYSYQQQHPNYNQQYSNYNPQQQQDFRRSQEMLNQSSAANAQDDRIPIPNYPTYYPTSQANQAENNRYSSYGTQNPYAPNPLSRTDSQIINQADEEDDDRSDRSELDNEIDDSNEADNADNNQNESD